MIFVEIRFPNLSFDLKNYQSSKSNPQNCLSVVISRVSIRLMNITYSKIARTKLFALLVLSTVFTSGCEKPKQVEFKKAPRPVSVITLKSGVPKTEKQVAGAVGSWKTEEIGFEVSGRVLWVKEPGDDIENRILDPEGKVVSKGTALAKVDSERYELSLEAAKAQVDVAKLQKESVAVNLKSGIPSDIEAATASMELAQVEYNRVKSLNEKNVTTQSELDQSKTELRTAKAKLAQLQSQEKQEEAKLNSAIATIKQSEQTVKDSDRSLKDTTLYSSFRGQVAEVHVVPGSVVAQGSPVVTIQMMDPIKVEVELSADESRRLRQRRNLPVQITMPDGSAKEQDAYVYMVDPSADSSTRTFTLTLLMLNKKIKQKIPEKYKEENIARTPDLWRMDFKFLPDAPKGTYFIEKESIRKDDQGFFIWKCNNVSTDERVPQVVEVEKLRVTPGDKMVPFLGNWKFQSVKINDGQEFKPEKNLFVGELIPKEGKPDEWNGDKVFIDSGSQWMLRPGDLVSVDLSETEKEPGFYVPMEAIYEESGKTWIFAVEEADGKSTAKKIPVEIAKQENLEAGATRRIVSDALEDGLKIVIGGVHFLHDGAEIAIQTAETK